MKKMSVFLLGLMMVVSNLMGVIGVKAASTDPVVQGVTNCKAVPTWSSTREPIPAYEPVEMEVSCKLVGLEDYEFLESKSIVEMLPTSDFQSNRGSGPREAMLYEHKSSSGKLISIELVFKNIVYRGTGSLFEIDGELVFEKTSDSTEKRVSVSESFSIAETGTVGEAPEPKLKPYIVKYEVSAPEIKKNDEFSIVMEVVDPNYRYSDLVNKKFDSAFALLSDKNFNAPNMQGEISNIGSDSMGNLKYEVRFNNIRYLGPDSILEFRINYKAQVLINNKIYNATIDNTLTRTIFETSNTGGSDSVYKPNILISNYTGSSGVIAGKQINFKVTFKNTSSSVAVNNIVIGVDGNKIFAMAKGVNKVFVNEIKPGAEVTIDLSMIAVKTAEPSSYPITFNVSYNYMGKGNTIEDGTMSSEIAIPITQVDRVRINYAKMQNAYVGMESELSYSILNTGLSPVKNAQIEVIDETEKSLGILYLGNIDPSKEAKGTNLYIMFDEGREYKLTLKLTYEDENFNQKEMREDFTVNVMGGYEPPIIPIDPTLPGEEPKSKNNNWLFFGGAAVIAALGGGFVLYKRRKNKQGVINDEDL